MPASMWQNPEIMSRETKEITTEVEGNHSNFEQKLAAKKTICHLNGERKAATVWQMLFQSSHVPKVDN